MATPVHADTSLLRTRTRSARHAHAPRGVGATVSRSAWCHVRHHDTRFERAQRRSDLLKLWPRVVAIPTMAATALAAQTSNMNGG